MIIKVNVSYGPLSVNRMISAENDLHLYRQIARFLSLHPAHSYSKTKTEILFDSKSIGTYKMVDSRTIKSVYQRQATSNHQNTIPTTMPTDDLPVLEEPIETDSKIITFLKNLRQKFLSLFK